MTEQPLFVLGVRRSGTTLLRVMLDRNSAIAIPDESYFIPQLAHRHPGASVDVDAFLDDVRRLSTLREWGLPASAVAERLGPGMTPGDAIGAIFSAYAVLQGKERWGDKTPLYMQYLPLLERTFPDGRFVHLVRDGRDAALSFLSVPRGIMTEGWGHPKDAAGFARLWRTEVEAAQALGRRVGPDRYLEIRYEDLVRDSAAELARLCARLALRARPGRRGCVRGCGRRAARGARLRDAKRGPPVGEGSARALGLPRDDHRLARRRIRDAALAALALPPSAAHLTTRDSAR